MGSGTFFSRHRPAYVAQNAPNTCWAASLEMWLKAELGCGWTQDQLVNSAGDFDLGAGGINISGLQDIIGRALDLLTIKMTVTVVNTRDDIPDVDSVIRNTGYVYIAYQVPDTDGGHANVLFSTMQNQFDSADPDPAVGFITRSQNYYFTRFPTLIGWRYDPAW